MFCKVALTHRTHFSSIRGAFIIPKYILSRVWEFTSNFYRKRYNTTGHVVCGWTLLPHILQPTVQASIPALRLSHGLLGLHTQAWDLGKQFCWMLVCYKERALIFFLR